MRRTRRAHVVRTLGQRMHTDLVLSPFGADPGEMLAAAAAADRGGFGGVYTYDHFSGVVAGKAWSRDPFAVLGAIAVSTSRVRIGVLVANMINRHPAQLASAVDTLQALAPGRVICGIGAGASPGTAFAAEHDAVGRSLGWAAERRDRLVSTVEQLRAIWRGDGVPAVVDGPEAPPIIVGASSSATGMLAADHADGLNLQRGSDDAVLAARIEAVRRRAGERSFEISVFDALQPDHPLGGDPAPLAALGADRRTLHVSAPYPVDAIERIAGNLLRG